MHCARWFSLIVAFIVMVSAAPAPPHVNRMAPPQEDGPSRGDDLARIQQWRAFLDPAVRAFTAAKMSTTDVVTRVGTRD